MHSPGPLILAAWINGNGWVGASTASQDLAHLLWRHELKIQLCLCKRKRSGGFEKVAVSTLDITATCHMGVSPRRCRNGPVVMFTFAMKLFVTAYVCTQTTTCFLINIFNKLLWSHKSVWLNYSVFLEQIQSLSYQKAFHLFIFLIGAEVRSTQPQKTVKVSPQSK